MADRRVIAGTRVVTKAEAYGRRGQVNDGWRRGLDVDDARRAFHVHDLGHGLLDDGSIWHGRRHRDHGRGLRHRRRLSVNDHRSLINGRPGLVNRLLRGNRGTEQGAGETTNQRTLGPMIVVMATNQGASDGAENRTAGGRGLIHLRVGRTDPGHREREQEDAEDGISLR